MYNIYHLYWQSLAIAIESQLNQAQQRLHIISALERQRREDPQYKGRLDSIMRPCLKESAMKQSTTTKLRIQIN